MGRGTVLFRLYALWCIDETFVCRLAILRKASRGSLEHVDQNPVTVEGYRE